LRRFIPQKTEKWLAEKWRLSASVFIFLPGILLLARLRLSSLVDSDN
jgi:hypothetical protein